MTQQLSFEDWDKQPGKPVEPAESPPTPSGNGDNGDCTARVFLGWEGSPLAAAADWLFEEYGADQSHLIIALPGANAARRLQELCALRAPRDWAPPRVLTQGALTDTLVDLEAPTAGRLIRTLAWERALGELPSEQIQRLARSPEEAGDERSSLRERLRLAETVRSLHGELAPEGVDFANVHKGRARPEIEEEALRWEALARAQKSYRSILRQFGLQDPHDARGKAIAEGRLDRTSGVVLIGVADMNELLARLLAKLDQQVTVLVVAPEEEAASFDRFGRLVTDAWKDRDLPLPLERWHVREKPVDQADAATSTIAGWKGNFAAHEVRIGVADEEVVPYLERRLSAAGVRARHAAGLPIVRSRPYRLLRAVGRYLSRGDFADLAALARDVDITEALAHGQDAALQLDRYHAEHLPRSGRGDWTKEPETPASLKAVKGLQEGLERLLGRLATGKAQDAPEWARPIRSLLVSVYGRGLDPENESERMLAEALSAFGAVLGELEEVPPDLSGDKLEAATAIELILRTLQNERIPPMPPRKGERVVELFGWLDLALDHAPGLVVTGFNEGKVPQSTEGHAFLPDSMRGKLGLPGDADRLARDAYATLTLLKSKEEVAFVTGRRSTDGDPLVPSRLVFHCPEEEVTQRVRHFLGDSESTPHNPRVEGDDRDFACPSLEHWKTPERMSVSSFRTYLASPYQFFLEHVCKLRSIDDRARELDPLRFGILTHFVLQRFGEEGPRDSMNEDEIAHFLHERLDREVEVRFGAKPLPAITLQREQLKRRLSIFARRQAEHRKKGWRIHSVEWKPKPGEGLLEVDGEAMQLGGQIDRIDVHDDGSWAILDYKTGDKQEDPKRVHKKRGGEWADLQLPLYGHLAKALPFDGDPALGYVTIGKDSPQIGFRIPEWTKEEREDAVECARDVVRRVRAGTFDTAGRAPWGDIFHAIWGEGMVGAGFGGDDA